MARRQLGMDPGSWDALPWWQQRMYLEGYEWEGLVESPDGGPQDSNVVDQQVHYEGGNKVTDTTTEEKFSLVAGEFTAAGFTEQTMG